MLIAPAQLLLIDDVATRLGVDRDAVSQFIKTRELLAVNVARSRNAKRPSWRIRPEDLETFERSRRTSSPATAQKKRTAKPAIVRTWI